MKKKIIFMLLIFSAILIFILVKFEYKNKVSGNNISKSDNTDILNISSYEANVTIEVKSNKNTNKYVANQKYVAPNTFKQEILEPQSIKGLTIVTDGGNVTLENKTLNLKTLYENFNGNVSNLSLVSFIEEYKNDSEAEVEETEEEIIMKTRINKNQNKYQMYQNLYINKKTKLPTKMEILDINKNRTVYILYNEITLNKTNKKDIL